MVVGEQGRVFRCRIAQVATAMAVHFTLALPATVLGQFTGLCVGLFDCDLLLPLAIAEDLQGNESYYLYIHNKFSQMISLTCSMNFCWAQSRMTVSTWFPANCERSTVLTHMVECGQSTTKLLLPSNFVHSIVLLCLGSTVTEHRKQRTASV